MKKELIEKIMYDGGIIKDSPLGRELIKSLENNIPDFQRIDEDRIEEIFEEVCQGIIPYEISKAKTMVIKYNSTLPEPPPALVPLPKEAPDWFLKHRMLHTERQVIWDEIASTYGTPANNLQPLPKETPEWFAPHMTRAELWDEVVNNYGTPEPKPSLPTVEELAKEIKDGYSNSGTASLINTFIIVAQHIHSKYSLHTREWWQDCEKFMHKGVSYKKYSHQVYPDGRTFLHSEFSRHDLQDCTPYTPPSAQDIIAKHNLSEEEIKIIKQS